MLKNRNTKQRQIILEKICSVSTHPTADEIFKMVKKVNPNIGIATVYRTLNYLVDNNQIIQIKSKNKRTRYDGNVSGHCHLICDICGEIFDIFDLKSLKIKSKTIKQMGFNINTDFIEIHGRCKRCSMK